MEASDLGTLEKKPVCQDQIIKKNKTKLKKNPPNKNLTH